MIYFQIIQEVSPMIYGKFGIVQEVEPMVHGRFEIIQEISLFDIIGKFTVLQEVDQPQVTTQIKRIRN